MSKKAKIILIIVGVLIVAGVGYYFYNKSKKAKEASKVLDSKDTKAIASAIVDHPAVKVAVEAAAAEVAQQTY